MNYCAYINLVWVSSVQVIDTDDDDDVCMFFLYIKACEFQYICDSVYAIKKDTNEKGRERERGGGEWDKKATKA